MTNKHTNLTACPDYADALVDLSDGELPPADRALVEAHAATCPGCRAELRRLNSSLAQVVGTIHVPPLSPGVHAGSLGTSSLSPGVHAGSRAPGLEARAKRAADGRRRVPTTWAAAAALACAVLLALGLWRLAPPREDHVAVAPPAHQPIAPDATSEPPVLREDAVLRQIALVEQQARLQTWLDLMPEGAEFDEQRARNESLLARFEEAVQ